MRIVEELMEIWPNEVCDKIIVDGIDLLGEVRKSKVNDNEVVKAMEEIE